jgi:hypothetical protein
MRKLLMVGTALVALALLTAESRAQSPAQTCAAPGSTIPASCLQPGLGNATYPIGATPLSCAFSGANTTTATCTLQSAPGQFAYFCGVTFSGLGATAATPVTPTITGLVNTITLTGGFTFVAGAAAFDTVTSYSFASNACQPASAVNTNIVITLPGAAGNTQTNIYGWGFRQ